ncbi:MAG TPA: hypothetical protein EYP85_09935 [Armatimonadetes bacterium]|nr:hypothetical protein [Armatimonadota bacterium]
MEEVKERAEEQTQTSEATEPSTGPEEQPAGSAREEVEKLRKQVADLERLRSQLQSDRDKALSELEKLRGDLARELATLRKQVELLLPPERREEIDRRRLEAELEVYRQKEQLAQLRRHLASQYGVPESALQGAETGPDMVAQALDYLAQQSKKAGAPSPETKEEKPEKDKAIAHQTLAPATGATAVPSHPPTLKELEARAKKIMEEKGWRRSMWGRAVLQAQAELERERRGQTPRKSKV